MFDPDVILDQVAAALPAIGSGIVVMLGFALFAFVARWITTRITTDNPKYADLVELAKSVAFWTILSVGVISGLGTMGVAIGPLIAGLGLTGFALGFALRDVISNLLAGVLVLVYQPFVRGDLIRVSSYTGTVRQIDLRYTTIQGEGETYLVPNQDMMKNTITLLPRAGERPPQQA